MRRSIATVSLSGTLPEKLEAAAAARFDGVENFENDLLDSGTLKLASGLALFDTSDWVFLSWL